MILALIYSAFYVTCIVGFPSRESKFETVRAVIDLQELNSSRITLNGRLSLVDVIEGQPGQAFGTSLASVATVTSPMGDSILIGCDWTQADTPTPGEVVLYSLADKRLVARFPSPLDDPNSLFGEHLTFVGPFGESGEPAFLVGAPNYNMGQGYAALLSLEDGKLLKEIKGIDDGGWCRLGSAFSLIGDLNDDGAAEFGIQQCIGPDGVVLVYSGFSGEELYRLPTPPCLRVASDCDGDGLRDFVVTAYKPAGADACIAELLSSTRHCVLNRALLPLDLGRLASPIVLLDSDRDDLPEPVVAWYGDLDYPKGLRWSAIRLSRGYFSPSAKTVTTPVDFGGPAAIKLVKCIQDLDGDGVEDLVVSYVKGDTFQSNHDDLVAGVALISGGSLSIIGSVEYAGALDFGQDAASAIMPSVSDKPVMCVAYPRYQRSDGTLACGAVFIMAIKD